MGRRLKPSLLKSKTNGGELALLASAGECNETRQNASAAEAAFLYRVFGTAEPCPDVGRKSARKRGGRMPFVPQDEPAVQKAKGSGQPDRKSVGRDLSYISGKANRATRA